MEKNLYFFNGKGECKNQQIALNKEMNVIIKDANSEFIAEDIKNIEIRCCGERRSKITLGPKLTFFSNNKKIVINDREHFIAIEVVESEEKLKEFESLVQSQEAHGLISYIVDNAPELYSEEVLDGKSIEELKGIKDELDELANCY